MDVEMGNPVAQLNELHGTSHLVKINIQRNSDQKAKDRANQCDDPS